MHRIHRRRLLVATAGLLAAPLGRAQAPKVLRIGWLLPDRGSAIDAMITQPFMRRMRELGYRQGSNFRLESEDVPLRSPYQTYLAAYRKVAARGVDILLAFGLEIALKSAMEAAGATPIVMIAINWDPLAKGYIKSLRRSGSNVTGVVFTEVELTAKRFQLLRETFPGLKAATVLWDELSADQWVEAQRLAGEMGIRLHGLQFSTPPYDYDAAFAAIPAEFRRVVMMLGSPRFALPERTSLPEAAKRQRLPTMYPLREYVDAGGMLSYGPSYPQMVARAADYVDRIAKGAKPGEMPIEQPSTFELIVNLRTAKTLGLTIPQPVLLRADRLIE